MGFDPEVAEVAAEAVIIPEAKTGTGIDTSLKISEKDSIFNNQQSIFKSVDFSVNLRMSPIDLSVVY